MDFLRQQLALIQERLAGLTPSQRMLAGALVAVVVLTLLYSGRFAGERDLVALYPSALAGKDLADVEKALTEQRIAFEVSGGQVKVAADQHVDAAGAIMQSGAAPGSSTGLLEVMLDKISPLASAGEFEARIQDVRETQIALMIKRWGGVRNAIVMINKGERGGLTPTPSGVAVDIKTDGRADAGKLARSAAASVLPLVPNLTRENVSVTVDDRAVNVGGSSNEQVGDDLWVRVKQFKDEIESDIRTLHPDIRGLQVMVRADVNVDTKTEKRFAVDPKNKLSMTKSLRTERTTATEGGASAEPGTIANVAVDPSLVGAAPLPGSTSELTEEENEVAYGKTETQVSTPAGKPTLESATVRLPRQHFVREWKGRNEDAEPTKDVLDAFVKSELEAFRKLLVSSMRLEEGRVTVSDYVGYDVIAAAAEAAKAPVATAGLGGLGGLAGSHAREIALAGLALASLFMVGRMVKRSSPPATTPLTLDDLPDIGSIADKRKRANAKAAALGSGLDIAGEVAEGGSIMMGQELDEEVLETSQMVDQVSGFVKENPDATAQLLKRWMNRE